MNENPPSRPVEEPREKTRGITRLLRATSYSVAGLRGCFGAEAAFRQELAMAAVLLPLGVWLGRSGVERALLVASVMAVLVVELLNSAIEAVIDRFGTEHHDLAGLAKDMGSAAVMLTLTTLAAVWGLVLFGGRVA